MSQMKIGNVPLTWGKFRQADPSAWPEDRVLREVKEAGFDAVTSFPRGGVSPEAHLEYLAGFGLAPTPGYFSRDFWLASEREEHVAAAREVARVSLALGLTELFVAVGGWEYKSRVSGLNRTQLAGHVGQNEGLTPEEYRELGLGLNAIGAATLEFGVSSCFHNHVGSVIETREECDRMYESVDPTLLFWGADSGHLAWGGADPVAFVQDYGPAIRALHLKDCVASVRAEGAAQGWDYGASQAAGIWTELGQGLIDYPAFFAELRGIGYSGWVLSEIDETQKPTPLQSARECREFLKSQGL